MSLGSNIRSLRQHKGWTQGQLSERTRIKVGHLSKLEQDEGDPKVSTLYKLLQAFECTPNALLMDPVEIRAADAILSMVFDRAKSLSDEDKAPLIDVVDKYCVACEMSDALKQTPAAWSRVTFGEPYDDPPEDPTTPP
jgi:transcriptional regulator with XRE-family HTH domain